MSVSASTSSALMYRASPVRISSDSPATPPFMARSGPSSSTSTTSVDDSPATRTRYRSAVSWGLTQIWKYAVQPANRTRSAARSQRTHRRVNTADRRSRAPEPSLPNCETADISLEQPVAAQPQTARTWLPRQPIPSGLRRGRRARDSSRGCRIDDHHRPTRTGLGAMP